MSERRAGFVARVNEQRGDQMTPESVQEATERRLRQVEEMIAEARSLIDSGEVPGVRELDCVRQADAAMYACVVLLRVDVSTPKDATKETT